jgi:ABC-type branched-subunit amino acid transport system ATPase component/MFS family permease
MTTLAPGRYRARWQKADVFAGASGFAAFVLMGISAFDQFDNAAFGLLGPEITRTFHTTAATYGLLLIPTLLLTVLLPLLFGYLGDHMSRIVLTVGGALLWAVSCVLTGLAPSLIVLALFRLVTSFARGPNVVHLSLLTDYYPTRTRGYVFGIYQFGNRMAQSLGLLAAGVVGQVWGWRSAFALLAIPGALLALLALRLREPQRGLQDALEAGEVEAPRQRTLGFFRAGRLLLKTPAYKRICLATAVYFAAIVGSGVGLSFYFANVFDVGPALRGIYDFVPLPLVFVAIMLGGRWSQRLMAAERADVVARLIAGILALASLGFVGLALSPSILVAVGIATISTALGAVAAVPQAVLVSRLIPAHIRTQGFGLLALFQFSLTPFATFFSLSLGDNYGFRITILAFVPLLIIGAAIFWSASSTVRRDLARLQDVALAEVHARRRAAEGIEVDVLEVRGVDAGYGNVQILFGVDFRVGPGEVIGLLGTNGAGKSTLLKVVSGLLTPTAGSVLLEGEDVTGLDAEITAARGLIQVPGGRGVFPGLSVERNLDLGTYLYWDDPDYCAAARVQVLELFPRLGERLRQQAGTLSGGEQQMLTLAQALMSKPKLLMIDELSLGLAPVVVQELLEAVREINRRGTPIVLVEQSVNIALALAHRAYFLEKGEVRFEGRTEDLMGRDDLLRSIFLEGASAQAVTV